MVTITARWGARARRVLLALVLVVIALVATAGIATAQPESDDGTGNYGFADTCDEMAESLDGLSIPGLPLPSLGDVLGTQCDVLNAGTHPGEAVNAVKDKMWESTFGKAVDSLLKGLGEALILAMTFWLKLPNSTMADSQGLFSKVRDYLYAPQIYALMASVIVCGTRLALARRAARAEEAEETFRVLARAAVMAGGLSVVLVAATTASDQFALWIVNDSSENNAAGMMQTLVTTSGLQAFSPGLILILAIGGMLGALAQLVFAVIRQGLLIVVVGLLPLAASMSGFDMGRGFYKRLLTWTVAFLLWKPIAAIVYMIAFVTSKEVATDPATVATDPAAAQKLLVGVVLLCSVGLLLPVVMRLASPIAGAVSQSGGGFGAAAVGGALATRRVATGAKDSRGAGAVRTKAAGGGNAGGGGSPPSGASTSGPRQEQPRGPDGRWMSGSRGPSGPPGRAGRGTQGAAGAAGKGAGKAAAPGAVGAAVVAAHAVGSGMRAATSSVDAAANPKGAPRTPSGAGRAAVPR